MRTSLLRRHADAEDAMLRAAMPRIAKADPKPAYRIPTRDAMPTRFRIGALTFKIADIAKDGSK